MREGGMALRPTTPAQGLHAGTYLGGRPTPIPSAGGSSLGAEGLRSVLGPRGLMPGTRPLCPQADQRPGRKGGRGWGQLRAAEGEPGRTARPGKRLGHSPSRLERRLWQSGDTGERARKTA